MSTFSVHLPQQDHCSQSCLLRPYLEQQVSQMDGGRGLGNVVSKIQSATSCVLLYMLSTQMHGPCMSITISTHEHGCNDRNQNSLFAATASFPTVNIAIKHIRCKRQAGSKQEASRQQAGSKSLSLLQLDAWQQIDYAAAELCTSRSRTSYSAASRGRHKQRWLAHSDQYWWCP